MIDSIGVDIIEIARIKNTLARFGERFTTRILSPKEIDQLSKKKNKATFLAGRFAAKEATIKALGEFFDSDVSLKDIVIINDKSGRPFVELPQRLNSSLKEKKILLSISHSNDNAVAVAVIG